MKYLILLVSVFFLSCDGGNDNNGNNIDNSCDLINPAFVEVPECMTDYLLQNTIGCLCQGEEFIYGFSIGSSGARGNFGSIIGDEFVWEQLSCDSISFAGGDVSGVLEGMTVLEPGLLEFIRVFDGEEPDVSECCCEEGPAIVPVI